MRALQRFRSLLPSELALAVELSHDNPRVRADAHRLEDALVSACIVTWHAMGRAAQQIVVEMTEILLDDVVLAPDADKLQGGLPPRRYARLLISNSLRAPTGPFHMLMPAPALVDDKPSSARRLQLAEVRDIIAQLQGMVTVSPEPQRGTAFEIYLPTVLPLEPAAMKGSGADIKHILYVDDYEPMRALVSDTLPDAGFLVTCCDSALRALQTLQAAPLGFDAVVSDYRLVGHSGLELLKQVRLRHPALPVIIISGYVNEALKSQAQEAGAALVVSKADDLSELCVALRSLLGNEPNPALVTYSEWAKL